MLKLLTLILLFSPNLALAANSFFIRGAASVGGGTTTDKSDVNSWNEAQIDSGLYQVSNGVSLYGYAQGLGMRHYSQDGEFSREKRSWHGAGYGLGLDYHYWRLGVFGEAGQIHMWETKTNEHPRNFSALQLAGGLRFNLVKTSYFNFSLFAQQNYLRLNRNLYFGKNLSRFDIGLSAAYVPDQIIKSVSNGSRFVLYSLDPAAELIFQLIRVGLHTWAHAY